MFHTFYKRKKEDYTRPAPYQAKSLDANAAPPQAKEESDDEGDNDQVFRDVDINNMEDVLRELDSRSVGGAPKDIEIVGDVLVAYKGEILDTSLLPILLCEECEKRNSVLKCEICDQIFCPKCYNLCHARQQFGALLHPHEMDKDLFVRPITEGDTSSVVVDTTFYLPNYECHEEYLKDTHDITKPNTLATTDNSKVVSKVPLTQAVNSVMYAEGDVLVYIDPVTKKEVYGRVESDWDFRNDKSAPTLIRGEGGGLTWYVVRYLGEATPKVLELLEQDKGLDFDAEANEAEKKQEALMLEMPNLDGVGSSQLREERLMASRINKRIAKMKKSVLFGPKYHLNPIIPKGFGTVNDGDDSSVGAVDDRSLCSGSTMGGGAAGITRVNSAAPPPSAGKGNPRAKIISTKKLTPLELRQAALPKDVAANRTMEGLVAAYSYIKEVEAGFNHQLYDIVDEEPIMTRRLKILLLSESSLTRVSDRLKLMKLREKEKIRRALTKRFARMFGGWTAWAFSGWKDLSDSLRRDEENRSATFIQKQIRCYLKRDLLEELRFKSSALMHDRWKRLHAQFHYCRWDTPGAITMDNKLYFSSIRDVNKYGRVLRQALAKFMRVAEKRRMEYLQECMVRWRSMVSDMQESDLKASHFLPHEPTHDRVRDDGAKVDLTALTQQVHQELYDEVISKTLKEVQGDIDWSKIDADPADDSRLDLNAILMGTERKAKSVSATDTDAGKNTVTPPPWHPSVGFKEGSLPSMPPLPDMVINEKNAPISQPYKHSLSDIQKYNSFRAKYQGPTDYSFWVIPGRLAMGRMPLGRARNSGPVDSSLHTMIDSLPQLLLAGISSFVSTMTPDEEAKEVKDYNNYTTALGQGAPLVQDIATSLEEDHYNVCKTISDSIINLKFRIEDKNIQLRDYGHIEDAPLRPMRGEQVSTKRMKQKAIKVRLRAKQWLLKEDVETSQAELNKVPTKVAWDNYPLIHNEAPLYEKIIPILWDIEQRLFNGENLYLYSKEGKGRSGMICALVMGRIYGLSATDTLLRMQTYFDCQKSQRDKAVAANCPQLRRQQDLVCRILQSTNNIYTGIQYRSQVDPETFIAENQHLKAGTPTLQNTKEYSPSVGGFVQTKTSYVMKQKVPTEKFKTNAMSVLKNSSSTQQMLLSSNGGTAQLISISENKDSDSGLNKDSLDLVTGESQVTRRQGEKEKKEEEGEEEEERKKEMEKVLQMYGASTLATASKALARPIEQRRPVYCDRPSQVHIDKTFSKLKSK